MFKNDEAIVYGGNIGNDVFPVLEDLTNGCNAIVDVEVCLGTVGLSVDLKIKNEYLRYQMSPEG